MNRNYYRSGMFAIFVLGGLYAWRNRFRIQQYLESRGIELPFDILSTGKVSEQIRGGVAKVTGKVEEKLDVNRREAV